MYFDRDGKCLVINAVVPCGEGVLVFGPPQDFAVPWIEQLRAEGRLIKTIRRQMVSAGASDVAWIKPNEEFDGKRICPHGGFVYLFPDGVSDHNEEAFSLNRAESLKKRITLLFQKMDRNRDGTIDKSELKRVMVACNKEAWTDQNLEKLFRSIDGNADGALQYGEFITWLFTPKKGSEKQAAEDVAQIDLSVPRVFDPSAEASAMATLLPKGKPLLCILGGRGFQNPKSKQLLEAIAALFSVKFADTVVVLTGGLPGVQETFAKALGSKTESYHMLPAGESSGFGVGHDMSTGENMEERMAIFGHIGDVYLTVEGGPGVAKEALAAHSRGALVLPLVWTGGASGGMFNFPAAALQGPAGCCEKDWAAICEAGDRGDDELVKGTAAAAVAALSDMFKVLSKK
jgi:hypothetical protein